ncbi:hypothetical protein [Saccharopolyspora pogona]|uniref:hypothetical protein n=1 Tax=Saccharopolyspora pogona TaxID=333966 RepID=UPI001CC25C99|nr:hypothetical protein [Saccharopolyspora pogona]
MAFREVRVGIAPVADPAQRPHGPRPGDTAFLLGVLAAKVELDAAVLADPTDESLDGVTEFVAGFHRLVGGVRAEDTRLRLLALRSIRTAFDLTAAEERPPLVDMASDAAMLTANLINTYRLQQDGAELHTELASVGQFLTDLDHALAELRT